MTITKTLTAVATATALLVTPGVADASGSHHKSAKAKHVKKHAAKKKRTRVVTTPAATAGQAAGAGKVTVASFADGVLTLTLADGSTLKGAVNPRTEIECEAVAPAPAPAPATTATVRRHGDDDASGEDRGRGRGGENENEAGDDHGQGEAEHGDDDAPVAGCDTTKLVAGTVVRKAKLVITGGVAVFDEVKIEVPAQA